MSNDKLAYMANQIATNFRSMPEQEAIAATAEHIRLFWSPSMRAEMEGILRKPDTQLGAVARAAFTQLSTVKTK